MPVKNVLFVHGYSETSLGAYFRFPQLLNSAGINVKPIMLSAFNSLDDSVSISDLAGALESRIVRLESAADADWDTRTCAIIAHSTGALIARRWMLDRLQRGDERIPSHLVTMAGANHGSTLAQAGKSVLGYAQKLLLKHVLTVGARVLTDLDYGSDFLQQLNREWLRAWNDVTSPLSSTYLFSMGGDSIGADPVMQFYWGTSERGSDNTVRISGANLNYRLLDADPNAVGGLTVTTPRALIPHIVLHGYSHFGDASGILGVAKDSSDAALQHVLAALAVDDVPAYSKIATQWAADTSVWANDPSRADDVNSTVIFDVRDRGDAPIDDCLIVFLDESKLTDPNTPLAVPSETLAATTAAAKAINAHQPIHNDVARGSYSFYLNWPKWRLAHHTIHIEAHSPSPRIAYTNLDYRITPEISRLILPNECTYVRVQLDRDADSSYALYSWDSTMNLDQLTWTPDGPFPPGAIT